MAPKRHQPLPAVAARDAADRGLRRLTVGIVAGTAALAAIFTGAAASSTHKTKVVLRARRHVLRGLPSLSPPSPTPPGGYPKRPPQVQQVPAAQAPPPPPTPPQPSAAPPAATSGGS